MLDKHSHLWWCKDEVLHEIHAQFLESSNHCVIDNFLGEKAFKNVIREVNAAQGENLLNVDG